MNIYQGNVEINSGNVKEWQEKLKGYSGINGYLSIYSNVELNNLKSVGGYLHIYSNAELKADNLKSVGGDLYINSNAELNNLKSVGGDLYINSNTELNNLKSVGGYLYIYSNINRKLIKRLFKYNSNHQWYLSNNSPEWILSQEIKKAEYKINGFKLEKEWFDKIRKDQLSADEVFAIDNIEHRRLAYEFMDKTKMSKLKDFKVLDEQIDEKGNKMRIVSFNVQNMSEDLIFYNCFCPSTKREYYLGTNQKTCKEAKLSSFGLKEGNFINEW